VQYDIATEESEIMTRKRAYSGSPFEKEIGFCRAIRVGNSINVAGTAPIAPDGATACPGDAYGQAKRCIEIMKASIEELGGRLEHVIRTRMILTKQSVWEEVGRAHGEFFAEIQPASTVIVVKKLVRDDWLVEMEAEAIVD
jgi:enamine deaminase RidA (YjgF/YER057c/UK114 family)